MSDSHQLILLLPQRLLDLWKLRTVSDGRLELRHIRAVDAEAVRERVAEVPCVQDERVVAGLGEVCGDEIPA